MLVFKRFKVDSKEPTLDNVSDQLTNLKKAGWVVRQMNSFVDSHGFEIVHVLLEKSE